MNDADILKILKSNPQIDPNDLEEYRERLSKLRESGVRRSGYKLVPPYGGRRVLIQEDKDDARTVRLRHSSQRA